MPRVNHFWEVKKGLKVDDIQGGWVGDGLGVGVADANCYIYDGQTIR